MSYFWLSFVDPGKVPGTAFLGVSIVETESADIKEAIGVAWDLECNPGGEVLGGPINYTPPKEFVNRLLQKDDLDKLSETLGWACY